MTTMTKAADKAFESLRSICETLVLESCIALVDRHCDSDGDTGTLYGLTADQYAAFAFALCQSRDAFEDLLDGYRDPSRTVWLADVTVCTEAVYETISEASEVFIDAIGNLANPFMRHLRGEPGKAMVKRIAQFTDEPELAPDEQLRLYGMSPSDFI